MAGRHRFALFPSWSNGGQLPAFRARAAGAEMAVFLLMVFGRLGTPQSVATTLKLIYNTPVRPDLQFRGQIFAAYLYVIAS
jgi:hypothetical protein